MKLKISNPFSVRIEKYLPELIEAVNIPTDEMDIEIGNKDYVRASRELTEIKIRYAPFLLDETRNLLELLIQMAKEEILNDVDIENDCVRYLLDEYLAAKNVRFDLYPFVYRMSMEDVYSFFDYMKVRILKEFVDEPVTIRKKDKYEQRAIEFLKNVNDKNFLKNLKIRC